MGNTKVYTALSQSIVTFNNVPSSDENAFICGILEETADAGISVDMIAGTPSISDKVSFAFTVADGDMPKLLPIVNKRGGTAPLVICGNVKITVKSKQMEAGTGFAAKVFTTLQKLGCLPLLVTTGVDEISLLVHETDQAGNVWSDLERELVRVFSEK